MRDEVCELPHLKGMRELSADEIHNVAGGVFENVGTGISTLINSHFECKAFLNVALGIPKWACVNF